MDDRHETQTQDEGRRAAIVDAAARVFAEKGFSGATNRDIGREAGVSPGLIYWYFEDKDDLFKAVVRRLFPLYELPLPEGDPGEIDLEQLLTALGTRFMAIMTGPDVLRLQRLMLTELIRFPEVAREIGNLVASGPVERLAAVLDARCPDQDQPAVNSRLVAQGYFGALIAYVLRKYHFDSADLRDASDDEMVATVVRIHVAALARDPAPRDE